MKINTISTKLILILLFAISIVFLIRAPINYVDTKKRYLNDLEHKAEILEQRLNLSIASPIWNLHYELVQQIIDIEIQDQYINAILINDIDGNIIANTSKNGIMKRENDYKKFSVVFMDEHIANVYILLDKEFVYDRLKNNFLTFFMQFLFVLVFVAVVFKIAINKFVLQHLKLLTKSISEFSQTKDFDKEIHIKSNDEFKFLADEFNNMKHNLKKSLDELAELNENLEQKIKIEVDKNSQKEKEIYSQSKFIQMGEMISNIAHHWRQPLSAISSTASGMKLQKEFGTLDDSDFISSIDFIMAQTKKLSSTIDDFRKFFIEEQQNKKIEFNLKETVAKLEPIIGAILKEKNIKLLVNIKDDINIYGFQNEFYQVLLNLIHNAIEAYDGNFSDIQKEIRLWAKNDGGTISIVIEDNAGGIPQEYLDRIFDPYFTTKHKKQGIGVSLYMCKEIIYKHHNGNIQVSNTQNGAKFLISIPTI
ncbi:ATP-binding protein [Arcobacter sp. FWKO B]|uniref:sensor histidine kinase n=1 Tax=Arcobacter sp. FWKO B TaxID=2593672 RepID=UPI001908691E|nr:ATP-binding protein [Arcobacter sp. FWKO B]